MFKKKSYLAIIIVIIIVILSIISIWYVMYTPKVTLYAINDTTKPINATIKIDGKEILSTEIDLGKLGVVGKKSSVTNLHVGDHS